MAELLLDRACYEEMSALASETGSTFLKDYVALQIDAVNLRTLVRARRMGCEDDVLAAAMLPGGHIPAGRSKARAAIIYRRSHTARRLTARASSRPNCLTAAGA